MTGCRRFEEEGLLLLEQGKPLGAHFATCPDCLAALAAYEQLRGEIAAVGVAEEPPPGWEAAVWERIERRAQRTVWQRWPRWQWSLGGVAAAAALAAALFFAVPRTPRVPSLVQEVVAGGETMRAAAPHPGDRLVLRAETAGAAYAELRLYRNGREMVLRCPGDGSCRQTGSMLRADFTIPAPGAYQAVLVLGSRPLPPPGAGLDADAGAAFAQGARVVLGDELTVR